MSRTMKSAFECKHVSRTDAWALLYKGFYVGRIVANYSENPNGSVCTGTIGTWLGRDAKKKRDIQPPLYIGGESRTGRAGGYGYDKFSAAFDAALRAKQGNGQVLDAQAASLNACGHMAVRSYLEKKGFVVLEVC